MKTGLCSLEMPRLSLALLLSFFFLSFSLFEKSRISLSFLSNSGRESPLEWQSMAFQDFAIILLEKSTKAHACINFMPCFLNYLQ